MKRFFRLSAMLIAMSAVFTGCGPDDNSDVTADFTFVVNGEDITEASLTFASAGEPQMIDVKTVGDWEANISDSWVTVSPENGTSSEVVEGELEISVEPYTGTSPRTASIAFRAGSRRATLTITQNGEGMGSELYSETFGPEVGANTEMAAYTGFTRGGALDQSGVTYASTQATAVRNSLPPTGTGFSGPALVFLNVSKTMTIGNINVTGNEALTLRFSAGILEGTYQVDEKAVTPTSSHIKIEAGYDGINWDTVDFTAEAGTGTPSVNNWAWVNAPFKVKSDATSIYIRISTLSSASNRFDDFSLSAGGDGALIEPAEGGGDMVKKTIAELRTAGAVTANWYLEGTVISDQSEQGRNLQPYQIALQDATTPNSGIMINYAQGETNPTYPVGTTVRVNLTNGTWSPYNGLIQIAGVKAADVTTITGTAITAPTVITVAQLKTGEYESMLIQINDAELVEKTPGATMNGASGNTNIMVGSETFIMRLAQAATFKNEPAPLGKGPMIGIANVYNTDYQVSPRNMADVAGMNGEGGSTDYFTVSPNTAQSVGYNAGSTNINVSSNIAWTASISGDAAFTIDNSGATGNGTVKVSYTENTSESSTRTATVTLTTTADVATKTYNINFTQAAKSTNGGNGAQVYTINVAPDFGSTSYGSYMGFNHTNEFTGATASPATATFDLTFGVRNGAGTPANSISIGANNNGMANCSLGTYETGIYSAFTAAGIATPTKAAALVNKTSFTGITKIVVKGGYDSGVKMALAYSTDGTTWTIHPDGVYTPGGTGGTNTQTKEFTFAAPVTGYFAVVAVISNASGNSRIQNTYVEFYN